jgi:hypothetical protein
MTQLPQIVQAILAVIVSLYALASLLGKALPGKAGQIAAAVGFDLGKLIALFGNPPAASKLPAPPRVPPLSVLALAALCLVVCGCSQSGAITADVVQDVQCVISQLEAGNDTFEDIAGACAPLAVAQVVTIVSDLASGDGGDVATKAKAVHHKATS